MLLHIFLCICILWVKTTLYRMNGIKLLTGYSLVASMICTKLVRSELGRKLGWLVSSCIDTSIYVKLPFLIENTAIDTKTWLNVKIITQIHMQCHHLYFAHIWILFCSVVLTIWLNNTAITKIFSLQPTQNAHLSWLFNLSDSGIFLSSLLWESTRKKDYYHQV